MANESRAFRMNPDMELEDLVAYVGNFLQVEKAMEIQSSPTTDGYVLQASQKADGWKTISGTRLAITVHFMLVSDVLNVTVGEGQWSDKIGAGAVGWFVAWPLAVSAGIGAFRQKKLPSEIFATVEKGIILGGRQVAIYGSGAKVAAGMVVCPQCKTQNSDSAKFCKKCGAKLKNNCPHCGAKLEQGSRFCTECGKTVE